MTLTCAILMVLHHIPLGTVHICELQVHLRAIIDFNKFVRVDSYRLKRLEEVHSVEAVPPPLSLYAPGLSYYS